MVRTSSTPWSGASRAITIGGNLTTSGTLTVADVDNGEAAFLIQAGTAGSNRLLNGPSCTLVNVLPPVAVTKLVATPATLLTAGTTTIVATTTSTTNVAFSVSPAVAGFNGTVAVSGGAASKQLTLPANTTSAAKYYNVTATPDGVTAAAMTTSVMVAANAAIS